LSRSRPDFPELSVACEQQPVVVDDRLLRVVGTALDPRPCFKALDDLTGLIERLSKELAL
jgi:hypothetical protein